MEPLMPASQPQDVLTIGYFRYTIPFQGFQWFTESISELFLSSWRLLSRKCSKVSLNTTLVLLHFGKTSYPPHPLSPLSTLMLHFLAHLLVSSLRSGSSWGLLPTSERDSAPWHSVRSLSSHHRRNPGKSGRYVLRATARTNQSPGEQTQPLPPPRGTLQMKVFASPGLEGKTSTALGWSLRWTFLGELVFCVCVCVCVCKRDTERNREWERRETWN